MKKKISEKKDKKKDKKKKEQTGSSLPTLRMVSRGVLNSVCLGATLSCLRNSAEMLSTRLRQYFDSAEIG